MAPKFGFAQVDQQLYNTPELLADAQHMFDEAAAVKPKYFRLGASWALTSKQKDPGTFVAGIPPTTTGRDWSTLDYSLNEALLLGADIVLIVGAHRPKFGGWLFGWGAVPGTAADFGPWVTEVATRYKPGGVGVRTDGKYAPNTGKGVRIFEVWNEQNDQNHWGQQISAKDYTDHLTAAYTAIKAVTGLTGTPTPGSPPGSGQSVVLFGGTYHTQRVGDHGGYWGYGSASLPEVEFVEQCYGYGAKDYFDGMACHVYPHMDDFGWNGSDLGPAPTTNLDNWRQLTEIRTLMVSKSDGAKTISITEAGFPNSRVTEAQQNTYWQTLWGMFSALTYVDMVLFYCVRDKGKDPADTESTWGAMRYDFTKKPVWTWLLTLAPLTPTAATATALVRVPVLLFAVAPTRATATAAVNTPMVHFPITPTVATATGAVGVPVLSNDIRPTAATATALVKVPVILQQLRPTAATASALVKVPTVLSNISPTTAAATAAVVVPVVKVAYDTGALPASTMPTGWSTKFGDTITVAGNTMSEGSNGGANNPYYTIGGTNTPVSTLLQYCRCVMGTNAGAGDRGQGPAVAFDSAYTNGVFAIGTGFSFGSGGVYTKIGSTITLQQAWTGNVTGNDTLEVRMTKPSANYVYTIWLNNVSTGISWTDTGALITPGKYCGVGFRHLVSGGQFYSMGIKGPIMYGDM